MKCSRCGAEVARATPGKLPLCPQCDAVLRPPEKQPQFDEPSPEPPRKEGLFEFLSNEFGQYKAQWMWLVVGVSVFCVLMLVLLCCTCGFLLPIDTRPDA
jgi:hypothetical protein